MMSLYAAQRLCACSATPLTAHRSLMASRHARALHVHHYDRRCEPLLDLFPFFLANAKARMPRVRPAENSDNSDSSQLSRQSEC
jgi:hypothetical protein